MTACDKREELNVVGTHVVTNVGVVLGVVLIRDLRCLRSLHCAATCAESVKKEKSPHR